MSKRFHPAQAFVTARPGEVLSESLQSELRESLAI